MRYDPNFDRYHCDHLLEKYEKLISIKSEPWLDAYNIINMIAIGF